VTGRGKRAGDPPPAPAALPADVLDSHCHLDIVGDSTGTTIADAVAAARAVGVRRVVTIGVDPATSRWAAEVAGEHPEVWAAVAVHPNDLGGVTDADFEEIARLAALPQVRAVGETGLDHYRTGPAGHRAQEDSFRRHIAIAKAAGRTLVIHDRDAHDDVLRVLAEERAPERVVFHCFSGDEAMARTCAARGYAMSFAGTLTFGNAGALRAAAAVVPPELLLVETDAPFLTPAPHRGRPNAPYLVPLTVRCLAEVRGEPVAAVCAAVWATGERMFGPL
jgi:TatD DNase family protein